MKYFEVVVRVTGCRSCPHQSSDGACRKYANEDPVIAYTGGIEVSRENRFELTPSCPLWKELKND